MASSKMDRKKLLLAILKGYKCCFDTQKKVKSFMSVPPRNESMGRPPTTAAYNMPYTHPYSARSDPYSARSNFGQHPLATARHVAPTQSYLQAARGVPRTASSFSGVPRTATQMDPPGTQQSIRELQRAVQLLQQQNAMTPPRTASYAMNPRAMSHQAQSRSIIPSPLYG